MKRSRTIRNGMRPCLPLSRTTANGVARPEALRRAWGSATPFDDSGRATHRSHSSTSKAACGYVAGFTLVEMLVAVTLVLLMMVMFGEVFQLASNSVTKQRVMADNDQNLRTFVTVLRADLDKRTFRTLVPYFPGELSTNPGTPFEKRRGYFYISNNNTADGTDDLLQFTVDTAIGIRNSDESPYYGHAVPLTAGTLAFLNNPNQPDRDDGQITTNNAGASRAAEVSYWLRGGKLFRRQMLIRDPLKTAGVSRDPTSVAQPTTSTGADFFAGPYPTFWADFDYSAHRQAASLATLLSLPQNARFNGVDFLSNDNAILPHPLPSPPFPPNTFHPFAYSLGQTWNRFGFNHEIAGPAPLNLPGAPYLSVQNGLPREFSSATPPTFFVGRFTHEETSSTAFDYPQAMTAGNPMDATTTSFVDSNNNSVIDSFEGGTRTGVDLLLSHVHEFRVEVWDERQKSFLPVGHTTGIGDYHIARQLNNTFAPLGGSANVFDTWHPNFDRNFNVNAVPGSYFGDIPDRPPFRPVRFDPTGVAGANPATTNPSGNGPYWAPATNYLAGDVIFPQPAEDLNFNGFLDPGEDGANGFPVDGVLHDRFPGFADDSSADGFFGFPVDGAVNSRSLQIPYFPTGLTLAYRCIRDGTSGSNRLSEPNWSSSPGFIMRDPSGNGPDWVVDYNVRPLRAIRVTVRFEHPTSRQMRQVTIVHSLRDTTSVP